MATQGKAQWGLVLMLACGLAAAAKPTDPGDKANGQASSPAAKAAEAVQTSTKAASDTPKNPASSATDKVTPAASPSGSVTSAREAATKAEVALAKAVTDAQAAATAVEKPTKAHQDVADALTKQLALSAPGKDTETELKAVAKALTDLAANADFTGYEKSRGALDKATTAAGDALRGVRDAWSGLRTLLDKLPGDDLRQALADEQAVLKQLQDEVKALSQATAVLGDGAKLDDARLQLCTAEEKLPGELPAAEAPDRLKAGRDALQQAVDALKAAVAKPPLDDSLTKATKALTEARDGARKAVLGWPAAVSGKLATPLAEQLRPLEQLDAFTPGPAVLEALRRTTPSLAGATDVVPVLATQVKALTTACAALPTDWRPATASLDSALAGLKERLTRVRTDLPRWLGDARRVLLHRQTSLAPPDTGEVGGPVAAKRLVLAQRTNGELDELRQAVAGGVAKYLERLRAQGVAEAELVALVKAQAELADQVAELTLVVTELLKAGAPTRAAYETFLVRLYYTEDVRALMRSLGRDPARDQSADDLRQESAGKHAEFLKADAERDAADQQRRRKRDELARAQAKVTELTDTLRAKQAEVEAVKARRLELEQESTECGRRTALAEAEVTRQGEHITPAAQAALTNLRYQQEQIAKLAQQNGERRQALETEIQGLDGQLTTAEAEVTTDLTAAADANDRAAVARMTERMKLLDDVAKFGEARDNGRVLIAEGRPESPDPLQRCDLVGFPDSKRLLLRGLPRDLALLRDLVAAYDRAEPQALLTLWTMSLNVSTDGPWNTRLNEGLTLLDKHVARTRSQLAACVQVLQKALREEVQEVERQPWTAEQKVLATAEQAPELRQALSRLKRYRLYHPEVLARLGFDPKIEPEYEQVTARLNEQWGRVQARMPSPAQLNDCYQALNQAIATLAPARTVVDEVKALDAWVTEPGAKQALAALREQLLRLEQTLAVAQATWSGPDQARAGWRFGQWAEVYRSAEAQWQTLCAEAKQTSQRMQAAATAVRPLAVSQSVAKLEDGARALSAATLPGQAALDRLKRWVTQAGPYEPLLDQCERRLKDVHEHSAERRYAEHVAELTRWALPDPAGTTTLGQALVVLALATPEHRKNVFQRAEDWLPGVLERIDASYGRKPDASKGPALSVFADLERAFGLPSLKEFAPCGEQAGMDQLQLEVLQALERVAGEQLTRYFRQRVTQGLVEARAHDLDADHVRARFRIELATSPVLRQWVEHEYELDCNRLLDALLADASRQLGMGEERSAVAPGQVAQALFTRDTVNARVSAANQLLKTLIEATERDLERAFMQPLETALNWDLRGKQVRLGAIQRTSVLASNRLIARVQPLATAELGLTPKNSNVLQAVQGVAALAMAAQTGAGSALLSQLGMGSLVLPTALGGAPGVGALPTQLYLSAPLAAVRKETPAPPQPPQIYGFTAGSTFQVTPVVDPSGQALRFRFDYVHANAVRGPGGAIDPELPNIEHHAVNTEVQLSNFDLREVSRFESNAQLSQPEKRYGGIPFLNALPILKEIPLIGYFSRSKATQGVAQQNLIFAHATVYPSIEDIQNLLTSPIGDGAIGRF